MYPGLGDEVLYADEGDFTKQNRAAFLSRMATGGYNYVFLTYEQFKAIPMEWDTVQGYVGAELEAFKEYLADLDDDDPRRRGLRGGPAGRLPGARRCIRPRGRSL